MAHHMSAKKRIRQTERRRLRNRAVKARIRRSVRTLTDAMTAKQEITLVETAFRQAQRSIALAKKKGVIHRNNMARRIGRLAKMVNKFKAEIPA